MTKYKSTIQANHGVTLTSVAVFNFLNNRDKIMDEKWELCVGAINNHANDVHTLLPTTIEEFYMVLNLHRDLLNFQYVVYAHLHIIKPTR